MTSARSGRSSRNARFKREDDRASFCAANEVETFCADGKKTRLPDIGWVRMRKGGANLRCCPQLRRANKALARKRRGSANALKAKTRLARLRRGVSAIRRVWLH